MGKGYITITVHTGDDAQPVASARVTIRDRAGNMLYQTFTDQNGNTDRFRLDAPDISLSFIKSMNVMPYAEYDVDVEKSGFNTLHVHNVNVFDTETSILPVDLHPGLDDEDIFIPKNNLLLPTNQLQVGSNASLLRAVFIPEYITVHLGTPTNTAARNVRVKFTDYIKNVVSSEIYPTWPYNSLVANTHAIITFALNRVYTEWYPSRGLPFDITNSTAYDQYFVEGRNIFENISNIVDNIFNVYARRFGFRNPFFTQFCSGTTATCRGLSQWGTVDLANRGFTPLQILRYYYPNDLELTETDNIQAIVSSYPGYPLSYGSRGEPVQRMQNFLNRIRVNFPLIPQISNPNGVFGSDTEAAVRTFQRTFNMTADGVIGKATWNKITQIYVGIIRLGELDSEGERAGIGMTPPTAVLRLNSSGANVVELQYILNFVSQYHGTPTVIQDGVFGNTTKNAVIEFQKTFGLTPDGIVGPATWNMLYDVYKGIRENAPVPPTEVPPANLAPPFPGTLLRLNSQGPDVRLMQTYLNTVRIVYNSIPAVVADGVFGPLTRNAVIAFQRQFLLTPDGIIGPVTWDKIVEQFLLVTGNASVSLEFPGTLRVGSAGSSVRLMQGFLRELHSIYPSIPAIAIDGIFGNETRDAVMAFQRQFGLVPDGIIGPITWNAIIEQRNKYFGARQ